MNFSTKPTKPQMSPKMQKVQSPKDNKIVKKSDVKKVNFDFDALPKLPMIIINTESDQNIKIFSST